MSKVLTGTVQGGAQDRSFELKGQVLIDGVQQLVDITGTFKIVNGMYDNLYVGEFSTDGLKAIFCITLLEGEGVFIAKEAKGPFAGLESGGIQAEFSLWADKKQNWTLSFAPIQKNAISVLSAWLLHPEKDVELVTKEKDKLRATE